MIRSMTGFGNAVVENGNKTISVDLRSLNSKFFDLSMRLPQAYRDKDMELRSMLAKEIERGKVEMIIGIDSSEPQKKTTINKELFARYYAELKNVSDELKINFPDYLTSILRLPDVISTGEEIIDEQEWMQVIETIHKALAAFNKFRDNEGSFMEKNFIERIEAIEANLQQIEPLEEIRIAALRKKLKDLLEESRVKDSIDKNRFEQEILYYLEKMDISEEKVRLRTHCKYFIETMHEKQSNGKKLIFISQEIGREINTLGAKANHADIQKYVVQMKDELERMKELLMNVL